MNDEGMTKEEFDCNIEDILEHATGLRKPKKIHKIYKVFSDDELINYIRKIASNVLINVAGLDYDRIEYGYFSLSFESEEVYDLLRIFIVLIYEHLYRTDKHVWLRYEIMQGIDEFIILLKEKDFLEVYDIIKDDFLDVDEFIEEDEFSNDSETPITDILESEERLDEIRTIMDELDTIYD